MKREERQALFIIFLIALTFSTIFYAFPQLIPPVELRINLQANQIVQGEDIVLFYKITNNKDIPMENAVIINMIEGSLRSINKTDIGNITGKTQYYGVYSFNSLDLQNKQFGIEGIGKHTVKTILTYDYQNESKREELTLGFEIFKEN